MKCITFDKETQESLPQHIKDKMKADRETAHKEQKPQFTTRCYIRIDDAQQRKEIYKQLQNLGYGIATRNFIDLHKIIVARIFHIQTTMAFMDSRFIDCGTNIDLFLDLAAMRSDTAINQWFVYRKKMCNYANCDSYVKERINSGRGRYATATEIIEWHKKNER